MRTSVLTEVTPVINDAQILLEHYGVSIGGLLKEMYPSSNYVCFTFVHSTRTPRLMTEVLRETIRRNLQKFYIYLDNGNGTGKKITLAELKGLKITVNRLAAVRTPTPQYPHKVYYNHGR